MTFDFNRWKDTVLAAVSATVSDDLLQAAGLIDPDYLVEEFDALLQQIEDDLEEERRAGKSVPRSPLW